MKLFQNFIATMNKLYEKEKQKMLEHQNLQNKLDTLKTLSESASIQNSFYIHDPFYDEYTKTHKIERPTEQDLIPNADLYEKSLCPICNFQFEKEANRVRKCPNCKTLVYTRTNILTDKKMILSSEQMKKLEAERDIINYHMFKEELPYRLKNREYGLYSNAKYDFFMLILRHPELEEVSPYRNLVMVYELLYLSISGPNNVKNTSPKICAAFNSKYGGLPPGLLGLLENAVETTNYTLEEYEKIFMEEMTKIQLSEMKLMPQTAWKKIKKHIQAHLLDTSIEE